MELVIKQFVIGINLEFILHNAPCNYLDVLGYNTEDFIR